MITYCISSTGAMSRIISLSYINILKLRVPSKCF